MLIAISFRLEKDLSVLLSKVVKEGPWGANVGKPFDTGIVDCAINVKIYHENVVRGFELTFQDGKTPPVLIGRKMPVFVEITLDEDENFTSISGYFKSETDVYISQLTLTTDMDNSISAGKKTGKAFCLTIEKGDHIVGFFGLHQPNLAVDAIGVHCSLADS
ncbi:hypothetical protein MUK42_14409 [Musa troglodytarum]|uniref:Jacalin-type lectin domain-containing protein n=1 Tax=Musa troglodytarum TaxID=320322 RepID=A0A9E7ICV4_9LILI|nr:hypothetical protein MUK42_14409 [Musa troglodytarum]